MEFITILLSGLLTFISPAGLVIDSVAENAIRSRFEKIEQLEVRVDNAPNYQVVQGKIEKVRMASRGLWLTPNIRIAELEVETDPIDIDIQKLRQRGKTSPLKALREPLQAGVRLVLSEDDINQTLRSPQFAQRLSNMGLRSLNVPEAQDLQRYEILNPRVEFLENNRLRFQAELQEKGVPDEKLTIAIESGLGIISGSRLQLIDPTVLVNAEEAPARVVRRLADGVSQRFDLATLERSGIAVRLLQLNVSSDRLEMAAFVRVEPR